MTDDIGPPARGRASAQQTDSSVTSYTSDTGRTDGEAAAPSRNAWTPVRVEQQLRKAAALRETLSDGDTEIAPGAKSIGIIGGIGVSMAGDAVVAEAAEALSWLRWLDPNDAGIVLARLGGAPWKAICWRFGMSRPTADRRWRYALSLIAWRLNGHARTDRTPSLRSLLGFRRAA